MGSVWKRLNRINKRAAKFHFTASYSELWLEAGPNWQPTALSVIWTRKSRRVVSAPVKWEPTMKNPYIGMCVWPVPENKDITVTMFRDAHKEDYDNKDWFFILEDVSPSGKRKPVAQGRMNMRDFCGPVPTQTELTVKLRPISKKVTAAKLSLTLTSELLGEGKATDSEMAASDTGSISTLAEDYRGRLREVEEEEEMVVVSSGPVQQQISSLTRQIEELANEPMSPERPAWQEKRRASGVKDENENQARRETARPPVLPPPLQPRTTSRPTSPPTPLPASPVGPLALDTRPRMTDSRAEGESLSRTFGSREWKSTANGPRGQYGKSPPAIAAATTVTATERKEEETVNREEDRAEKLRRAEEETAKKQKRDKEEKAEKLRLAEEKTEKQKRAIEERTKKAKEAERQRLAEKARQQKLAEVEKAKNVRAAEEARLAAEEMRLAEVTRLAEETRLAVERARRAEEERREAEQRAAKPPAGNMAGSPVRKIVVTEEDEEDEEEMREPGGRKYSRTKSQEFRDYQADFVLSSTIDFGPLSSPLPARRAPTSPPQPAASPSPSSGSPPLPVKTEIAPSSSFLDNLNRNSTIASSPSTTPSSLSPEHIPRPFERGNVATATMQRREKVLQDRTNSLLRQNTTSAQDDLLEWCQSICSQSTYSNVKVTNFVSSWRNGLAFCAIIHSFYPDLIPFNSLSPANIKENCKLAFEAAERLGVGRLIEPSDMVIRRLPDKLLVITYLHQLRSAMGKEETRALYEQSRAESTLASTGVKKSFSESNIRLFSRSGSNDAEPGLETIQETPGAGDIRPEKITEYRKRAQTLVKLARSESRDLGEQEADEIEDKEKENDNGVESPPRVMMRQKSSTPKLRKDNRLSYIDNEIKVLDAEQVEVDKQLAILERRLRETSEEDDATLYDALLQQFLTLVNKKNALMKRQFQLNMLEKEEDLEKKLAMLQEELRVLSELEDHQKTEEDRGREELLLLELVECVQKRNELVMQQDESEKQIEVDEALDQEVTAAENEHLRNKKKEDCRMQ